MPVGYVLTRVAMFFLVIWAAASIMFIIPRLARAAPVQSAVARARFGLDRPIVEQYGSYLWDVARLDFGPSITYFPSHVGRHIQMRLPWTVGLLTISAVLAFAVGNLLGAVLGWPGAPPRVRWLVPLFMPLMALPYYLLGLILVFLFAFIWPIFPFGGGYSTGAAIELTPAFAADVLRHGMLPALSIVLSSIGFWMIQHAQHDDHQFGRRLYDPGRGQRTLTDANLPSLCHAQLHAAPGHDAGHLPLGRSSPGRCWWRSSSTIPAWAGSCERPSASTTTVLIQGIVFVLILSVATAMLVLDLVAPLVDRRIVYERR